jgi:hypothetical protein
VGSLQVHDKAARVPSGYEPPVFQSRALQHSKPKLTWDADNADRTKVLLANIIFTQAATVMQLV